MKKKMNIQNLLQLSGFQNGMVNDYVEEFSKCHQEIDREWLASYGVLGSAMRTVTHIFIEEVQRGHIYCDDLFYSLLEKYTKNFNYCDEETRIVIFLGGKDAFNSINWNFIKDYTYHIKGFLLCYDFCKEFLHYFDSLIMELHLINCHKDFITKNAIFAETCPTKILTDAVKNNAKDIIRKMENKGNVPYLHTKNTLLDIIARLSQENSNPVKRKLNINKLISRSMKEEGKFPCLVDFDDIRIDVCPSSPSFPGDGDALFDYIQHNLHYPKESLQNCKEGDVCVRFTVKQDGSFYNVRVERSSGDAALDREALRVIQSMPQWKPAFGTDKDKTWDRIVPVRFRLAN